MAGATAIGIGSALHYRGEGAFSLICQELVDFMSTFGYSSLAELRGLARREPRYALAPSTPPIP